MRGKKSKAGRERDGEQRNTEIYINGQEGETVIITISISSIQHDCKTGVTENIYI